MANAGQLFKLYDWEGLLWRSAEDEVGGQGRPLLDLLGS